MDATVTAAAIGVGGSVIVALAAFWANVRNTNETTALALRAVELTEQGQVTDRYTKAIEQLGADKSLDVRIGGIYALERVARDSPRDHPTVMEVLAAFVREHSREQWPPVKPEAEPPRRTTRPDVQAAVTVIGRRNLEHDRLAINLADADLPYVDLGGANLDGATLSGANLIRAKLIIANLRGANLNLANLRGARLRGADLSGADLSGADLTGADLSSAILNGADLVIAILTSADLHNADLRNAILTDADLTGAGLSSAGLSGAHLAGTIYPETEPIPDGWVRDPGSGRLRRASEDARDAGD